MIARGALVLDVGALADRCGWVDPAELRCHACSVLVDLPPGMPVQVVLGSVPALVGLVATVLLDELEVAGAEVVLVTGSRADAVAALVEFVNARAGVPA